MVSFLELFVASLSLIDGQLSLYCLRSRGCFVILTKTMCVFKAFFFD